MDENSSLWRSTGPLRRIKLLFREARHFINPLSLKIAFFSALLFILSAGHSLAFFSADAMLIHRVGPSALLYVYVLESFLAIFLTRIFVKLVRSYGRPRMLKAFAIIFASTFFAFWFAIQYYSPPSQSYLALTALVEAVNVLTIVAVWILASSCFNNFEAKAHYPFILCFGILGKITGALLAIEGIRRTHPLNFLLLWAVMLAISPLFVLIAERLSGTMPIPFVPAFPSTRNSERSLSSSKLIILLFAFWAAFFFFLFAMDIVFNSAVAQAFADEKQIVSYFAKVAFLANAAILLYQVSLAKPLARAIGMDRVIYVMPVFLAVIWSLVAFHPSFTFIALAQGILTYFGSYLASDLMHPILQVFPLQDRGAIETFTESYGKPVGALLLLLLAAIFFGGQALGRIAPFIFSASLLFLALPLLFQRLYRRHLADCLQSEDMALVSGAVEALAERKKNFAVPALLGLLEKSESVPFRRMVLRTLGEIRDPAALNEIFRLLASPSDSLKFSAIDALARYRDAASRSGLFKLVTQEDIAPLARSYAMNALVKMQGGEMIPLLKESLQSPSASLRSGAIEAIGMLKDSKSIPILSPFLFDEDIRVRPQAIIALYPFPASRKDAQRSLAELYYSKQDELRSAAIFAIGMLQLQGFKEDLLSMMVIPSKQVLANIMLALARMKNFHFCGTYVRLLLDREEEFALNVAERLIYFTKKSRLLVFEEISKLPLKERMTVDERLDQVPFDFSSERKISQVIELIPSQFGSPIYSVALIVGRVPLVLEI